MGPARIFSLFRWRVDEGPWGNVTREDPLLDMWEMGFWATMGWIRLGERTAGAGQARAVHRNPQARKTDRKRPPRRSGLGDLDDLIDPTEPAPRKRQTRQGQEKRKARGAALGHVGRLLRRHPRAVPSQRHPEAGRGDQPHPLARRPARNAIHYLGDEPIAADGTRQRFWLDGLWEMARDQEPIPSPDEKDDAKLRGPILAPPDPAALAWMGVAVPHVDKRPELGLLNRRWYRKLVTLPADLKGRHVSLASAK